MYDFQVGDLVARKSYGGDVHFTIADIKGNTRSKPVYVLRGLYYRIEADAYSEDLVKSDVASVQSSMQQYLSTVRKHVHGKNFSKNTLLLTRLKSKPGRILHIDSSKDFLDMCLKHYREAKLEPIGMLSAESQQPGIVRRLLEQNNPDILVLTGHDALKRASENRDSMDGYRNSKYFIQSVIEARKYQADKNRLSIFAGACQSYYEGIMDAGANFASSPGRVLINALDPAIVSEKIALTDTRIVISPREISRLTISGSNGIGGINTRGHLKWV